MAITLQGFKDRARVDFNEDDAIMQDMLDSAIEVIEEYTSHSLSLKTIEYKSVGKPINIYQTPIEDIIVDGHHEIHQLIDGVVVDSPFGTNIVVSLGISNKKQLESAVYQLACYYYENREPDHVRLPVSIQTSINQLRRGII